MAPTTPTTLALTAPEDAWRLAANALLDGADQRRRVGLRASGELEAERAAGRDIRTGATRVVRVLAEADTLERFALAIHDSLADGPAPPQPRLPLEPGLGEAVVATPMAAHPTDTVEAMAAMAERRRVAAADTDELVGQAAPPAGVPGWAPDPAAALAAVQAEEAALATADNPYVPEVDPA